MNRFHVRRDAAKIRKRVETTIVRALNQTKYEHVRNSSSVLQKLGALHGTDKCMHRFNGETYLETYDRHFEHLRRQPITVLEIGVHRGHSLRMWRDYFSAASIYGLDVNPNAVEHRQDRIHIEVGSQDDPEVIERLCNRAGSFDIVIDDGAHLNKMIMKSYDLIIPQMNPGGFYCIEDLSTSYRDLSVDAQQWAGMRFNRPDIDLVNHREELDNFFVDLIHDMDHGLGPLSRCHFYANICVLQLADSSPDTSTEVVR